MHVKLLLVSLLSGFRDLTLMAKCSTSTTRTMF